ncbi:MAG: hypothetical protein HYR91_02495 [Flavobacteriia bacterium]|nr:hypothetical protein [Flavobacteriia bacterium]
MENNTTIHTKEKQLLEARREGLKNAENTSIRPHGKLWDMDVFSWYKPNIQVLTNTIHAFPYPVIWVGNSADILNAINEDETIATQLHAVMAIDNSKLALDLIDKKEIPNVAGTNEVEHTLALVKATKHKNTILLFSASDENWENDKKEFDEFIALHQN